MFQQMQALAQKQVDNILWRNKLSTFLVMVFSLYLLCFSFFQIVYPRTSTVLSVLHWYILFLLWYIKHYFLDVVLSGRNIQEYLFEIRRRWVGSVTGLDHDSGELSRLSCAWHECWNLCRTFTSPNNWEYIISCTRVCSSGDEGTIYVPENMFCSIWHRCSSLAISTLLPYIFAIFNVM
jgi:hypothetical protein